MAITASYQVEIGTSPALLLGPGTAYGIARVEGLDFLPDIRTSDVPRPAEHGLFAGRDFAGGRVVTLELVITAATDAAFRTAVDDLGKAMVFRQDEIPLSFRLPQLGGDRRIVCRPRRRALPTDHAEYPFRLGRATVEFDATDPRVYSDAETVLSTGPATAGGGRTYDLTFNRIYAAGGTGGNLTFTNVGTFESRPRLKITGPCTDPKIESVTEGKFLKIVITLPAGSFIDIDLQDRTILEGGTASRYSLLTNDSSWWVARPEANEIKFTTADAQGTLELRARSAWL